MLPNHAPLVVAEQFAMLEALHPGRIDVGIGRAPGTDQGTAAALRRSAHALGAEDFPRHLLDVMCLLGDDRTELGWGNTLASSFRATPVPTSSPGVFLLGSSGYSAELAGHLGLPFGFAHHFDTGGTLQAIELYRNSFKPSAALLAPYVIVTVNVLAAETAEGADWHSAPARLTALGRRTGRFTPLPSPAAAAAHPNLDEASRLPSNRVVGEISQVIANLQNLADQTGADELMVTAVAYDLSARVRSLELLAEHWPKRDFVL
jgi:luciferase family oxidoreductase group 1